MPRFIPQCSSCYKVFATMEGMESHCRAKGHRFNRYTCGPCNKAFGSLQALEQHLNSPRHAYDLDDCINSSIRHICPKCAKEFVSAKALSQHESSLAHKARTCNCPFCSSKFKSPSGVAFHLESGCHQRIARQQVTFAVHTMKIVPNISAKPLLIENAPAPLPTTPERIIAFPSSFNGKFYQCHICYKTFRTLYSLTGHLNSPTHDEDEFRCPKCKREFKLISGFIQHLESRSCGLAQSKEIQGHFNNLSDQFSRLLKR